MLSDELKRPLTEFGGSWKHERAHMMDKAIEIGIDNITLLIAGLIHRSEYKHNI